jgi:hypothetical protein
MNAIKPTTMMPVSGRIPEDLYQWLSTTELDGASTTSDKLRVAVATLKRLHDGDADYEGALAMHRDLTQGTRQQISRIEASHGHSEVLATVMEHAPAISAALTAAQVRNVDDAMKLELLVTRRCLLLAESLLRQAVTSQARAYNGKVVIENASGLVELVSLLRHARQSPTHTGEQHG